MLRLSMRRVDLFVGWNDVKKNYLLGMVFSQFRLQKRYLVGFKCGIIFKCFGYLKMKNAVSVP